MTKVAFFHDHRFFYYDKQYYASSLSADVWKNRYLRHFEKVIVTGRLINSEEGISSRCLSSCEGVEFNCIQSSGGAKFFLFCRGDIRNTVLRSLNNADCAIIRLPSFIGFSAIRECVRLKKPYLVELVACPRDAFTNHGIAGKVIASYLTKQTKKSVAEAPYVEYVTESFLQERYPTAGKSLACSDVQLLPLNESVLKARLERIQQKSSSDPLVLGTVGALDVPYKAQERVLKAMRLISDKYGRHDFRYEVVGGGSPRRLLKQAEENRVADRFKVVGQLPHDEVFRWLDSIDIYVQPSKQEGLPRALIEAMSQALPSLGARTGGIPELLQEKWIVKSDYKCATHISKLLMSLSRDELITAASVNFEKAKKYERETLMKKRDSFIDSFIQEVQAK